MKLDQLTKDLPQDQRDFAINAYDYAATNSMLSSYYDPLKFAMILLDAHKAKPDVGFNQLLMGVDYSAAIDPEHIRRWGIQQATAWLQSDWKSKPEQKAAIAEKTGQSLFDAYSAKPQPDIKDVNALCRKFWDEAKAAVAGGQTAQNQQQASSQPPPATQPTTKPQQQTDASKSPHQSDVDKNIDKAKKAKDTADKIKGIFGR